MDGSIGTRLQEVFMDVNEQEAFCGHIGLFTNNLKSLVDFYTKILGFRKIKEEILPEAVMESIFNVAIDFVFVTLLFGKLRLEIFNPLEGKLNTKLNKATGFNHWAFCVSKKQEFINILKAKKVKVVEIDRGDHSVFFVRDPDNNMIEIKGCAEVIQECRQQAGELDVT
jgi:catechol 2,3-dioxygenase-like lactoylglutathione lyase family enzyme